MRHITAKPTKDRTGVEVDITRDAEAMLDQVARLFVDNPDVAEDILNRLGSTLRLRDNLKAEGNDSDFADAHADAIRDELLATMEAFEVSAPVTVRLSATEAADLAAETQAAADRAVLPQARPVHEIDRAPLTGGRVPQQRKGGAAA
ncbi:hypothetical protein [Actinacidiphila glaucinigra]|uniref:hypothetical protein n=1 Tax=Actinacidiphila glaucinigra TaxID=235986 RepID=UPI0035DE6254